MTDNRPIGIVVAAVGISEEVCNLFKETLKKTTPSNFVYSIVTKIDNYTLSAAKNQGILTLLSKCRVIICTDVDMLVPAGLVEYTQQEVIDGVALWAKCRNLEFNQANSLDWGIWKNLQVRECGKGSWVAMTVADWLKTGGWDERLSGYGGEDDVLAIRREERGIETKITKDFPLMHVNHPQRQPSNQRVGQKNLELGTTQPPKNFLTARLPILDDTNNHFNIFVTSNCTRDCPQCSQRGFRTLNPNYEMSLSDVSEWIQHTKASGYPPYHSLILTGGEPLLWRHLYEGTRMLHESGLGQQLNLFSNSDCIERVTDELMESLTTLRLSHYSNNTQSIELLKRRYGNKVSVVERQQHFPIPTKLAGNEVLPAKCTCEGPTLIGRQVYGCPLLVTVANKFEIDLSQYPESQCKLQVGYLELLAGFPRTTHDCCRGCIGNSALQKNAVAES